MNAIQARWVERSIVALCAIALVLIFQPYSIQLFSIGCVLVIAGGLVFNLVPFCEAGVPAKRLLRVLMIVCIILAVAAMLGIGTAFLYVEYLESLR